VVDGQDKMYTVKMTYTKLWDTCSREQHFIFYNLWRVEVILSVQYFFMTFYFKWYA